VHPEGENAPEELEAKVTLPTGFVDIPWLESDTLTLQLIDANTSVVVDEHEIVVVEARAFNFSVKGLDVEGTWSKSPPYLPETCWSARLPPAGVNRVEQTDE
jgi:hypothetical protein